MPRVIKVTPVEVDAARLVMKLAEADGRSVEPGIAAIANARRVEPAGDGAVDQGTDVPRTISVTPVAVAAARLVVKLAEADGRTVEPAILAIANAKPAPQSRSARVS